MRKHFAALLLVLLLTSFSALRAQTDQRTIGQMKLKIGGVTANVSPAAPVVPKNIASGVRIVVTAGGIELSAAEVSQFLGGEFKIQGTLSGPGLPQTVDVPPTGDGALITSDPLLLLLPSLPKAGDYTLSNLRFVVGENTVLDITPSTVIVKVIDQVLVTSVATRALTLEEIQEKGIVLEDSDSLGFEFQIGLVIDSQVINFAFPVVFTREGIPVPQPLELPQVVRESLSNYDIPDFMPVLMTVDSGAGGGSQLPLEPGGGGREIHIPAILVIPGNVGYLKQFFSAQLYVANGAPAGSNLAVQNVTAKINLPPGADAQINTPDDPLSLPATSEGPQSDTLPVLGPAPDGSLTETALDPGDTGEAEFLIRGEKEGYHAIDFDIKATLQGLATGPVAISAKTSGGVLVRNPYFNMTFITPGIVRKDDEFSLYVSVWNISQALANNLQVSLNNNQLSGALLLSDATLTIDTLRPGEAKMLKYQFRSQRTGKVIASYLHLDTETGTTGNLLFSLGVDTRNVPLSPDTLTLPVSISSLPIGVVDAAMQVLGEAWGVANAPSGTLPAGVIRICRSAVTQKALALAEIGLRHSLGQPMADALKDLSFDFWGGSPIDPGFDQLLRESEAGQKLALALGESLADPMQQSGGPLDYQLQLSQVAVSGSDFILFTAANGLLNAPVTLKLTDIAGASMSSGATGGTLPGGILLPLGAPANAPVLGLLTSFSNPPYVLDITGLQSGTMDFAISVPRGDGNVLRATARGVQVEQGLRMKLEVLQSNLAGIVLKVDTASDGSYADSIPLTLDVISPPGPTLISATIIGPETVSQANSYGLQMALLFDRVVDKTKAMTVANYSIPSNSVQSASRQLSGRLVFASLDQPEGPYVPSTVQVTGMADLRGMVSPAAIVPLQSKVQRSGAVITGRVMHADGSAATDAVVTYINRPPLSPGQTCFDIVEEGDYKGISAVPVSSEGYYQFRFVTQSDCGSAYRIATTDTNTGALHYTQNYVRYAGERLINDFVFYGLGSITGTVRNLSGEPVYGAEIYVLSDTDSQVSGKAVSDGDGHYAINGITVGPVTVRAVKGLSIGLTAGNIGRAETTSIIDVTLDGDAVRVSGTVKRTQDGVDYPIPGIQVVYKVIDETEKVVGVTRTDINGSFVLSGMPVGAFRIETGLYGLDRAVYQGIAAANDDLEVRLVIVPREFGTVKGSVKLPSGDPAGGAIIKVGPYGVKADEEGNFSFAYMPVSPSSQLISAYSADGMRYGQASVIVNNPDQPVTGILITLSDLGTAQFTVVNASGQPVVGQKVRLFSTFNSCGYSEQTTDGNGIVTYSGLRFGIVSAKAVFSGIGYTDVAKGSANVDRANEVVHGVLKFGGAGTITGMVFNPDGGLSHGALVELISNKYDENTCELVAGLSQQLTTGTNGTFQFNRVNIGKVDVRASQAFYPTKVGATGRLEGNGDSLDFTLQLLDSISGELSGTVFLPDGVTPAGSGVEVTANGPLPDVTVVTNVNGYFTFAKIFPAGRYTLTANDPVTGGTVQEVIELKAGLNFVKDLRLLSTGSVRVHVVDGAGMPVSAAIVKLSETEYPEESFDGYLSSSDGIITFNGVVEGPLNIVVTDNIGRGGRASATLPHGVGSIDVQVQLTTIGTVQGHFYTPAQEPIPYGAVSLLVGDKVIGRVTTQGVGDIGFFSFDYVPAGPFTLKAQDPTTARIGYAAATLESEGQVVSVDVTAGSIGTVQGKVSRNEELQSGAMVQVVSGTFKASTMTDSNGNYSMGGVPEGTVTVTASLAGGFLSGTASATLIGDGNTITLDVAMRTSGSITGRILKSDGVTPATLSQVTIEVGGVGGGKVTTITNSQGNYSFTRVPAGEGTILVEVLGSIDKAKATVTVPENATVNADITLIGTGSISGLALNSDGQPVGGIVDLSGTGPFRYDYRLTADSNGIFNVPTVLAGPFTAKLKVDFGDHFLYGFASGIFMPDQVNTLQIQLQSSGTVKGQIIREDGETPAVGADVTIKLSGGTRITLQSQAEGYFEATGVPLGAFTTIVHDPVFGGYGWVSEKNLVNNGDTVEVGKIVLTESGFAVVETIPVDGAENFDINSAITIKFNSPIETTYGISLTNGGVAVGVTRDISEDHKTVTMTGNLPHGSELTLSVSGDVVDMFYRRIQQPYTIRFTTTDMTGPVVNGISPADHAIQVDPASIVTVTFNEALSTSSSIAGVVTLNGPGGPVNGQTAFVPPNQISFTPSGSLSKDAQYTVTVSGAVDGFGNPQSREFESTFMTTDTILPELALIYPTAGGAVNNTLPTVRVSAIDALTGIDQVTAIANIDNIPATVSFVGSELQFAPATALAEGTHNIYAEIKDRAGLSQTLSASFDVDTTAPGVPVISGLVGDQVLTGMHSFSATATDNYGVARIEVYANGTRIVTLEEPDFTENYATDFLADGAYAITARAIDKAGTAGPLSDPIQVYVSNTSLTIDITSPPANALISTQVNVAATPSKGVQQVSFSIGSQTVTDMESPFQATLDLTALDDGQQTITVDAIGLIPSETASATRIIIVDHTPPNPPDTNLINAEPPVNGASQVHGLVGSVEAYATVLITHLPTGNFISTDAAADGTFTANVTASLDDPLSIIAVDAAGNSSFTSYISVRSVPSIPPSPRNTSLRYEGLVADRVGLVAGSYLPDANNDAVFTLNISVGENTTRTISYITLSNNANTPLSRSTQTGKIPLGIASDPGKPLLNAASGAVSFTITSSGMLSLFAGDAGFIFEGGTYTASAIFTDGSKFVASCTITPAADRAYVAHSARIAATSATVKVPPGGSGTTELIIDNIRDIDGTAVPDNANLAVSAANMASSDPTGKEFVSAGGAITNGDPSPNKREFFRYFPIKDGKVTAIYTTDPAVPISVTGTQAIVQVQAADLLGNVLGTKAIATIEINIRASTDRAIISMAPTQLYGDGFDRRSHFTIEVRDESGNLVQIPTYVLVSASDCASRNPNGYCYASAGGEILGGEASFIVGQKHYSLFRTTNGMVEGDYSSSGIIAGTRDGTKAAVIQVLSSNINGEILSDRALGTARLPLIGAASAVIEIFPNSVPFIFPEAAYAQIFVDHIKDMRAGLVPDGSRILLSASDCASRDSNGYCIGSAGGTILGGEQSSDYRIFSVSGGRVIASYSLEDASIGDYVERTNANIQVLMPDYQGIRTNDRAVGWMPLLLLRPNNAVGFAQPSTILGDGGLHTSTVTFGPILDSIGNTLPEGSKVIASVSDCAGRDSYGYCVGSAGGQILNGVLSPSSDPIRNIEYKVLPIQNGQVVIEYANQNIVANPGITLTANAVLLPVSEIGELLDNRVMGVVPIGVSGLTSATGMPNPSSVFADGSVQTTTITLTDFKDAMGQPVPDGTTIAVSAKPCFARDADGYCIDSKGGEILGGVPVTISDLSAQLFTILNGQVVLKYSSQGVPLAAGKEIARVVARSVTSSLTSPSNKGIVSVPVQLLAPGSAMVGLVPSDLLADGGDHRSQVIISQLMESDGITPIPDGAKVGLTVTSCGARNQNGYCIDSVGGKIYPVGTSPDDGMVAPNNTNFQIFTVAGGQVQAIFTDENIAAPVNITKTSRLSVVAADSNGNILTTNGTPRSIATGEILLQGMTSATASGPAELSLSSGGSDSIIFSGIKDKAGNVVPDGTKVAVSANDCASRNTSGYCVASTGGTITDGESSGIWKIFTVQSGSITVTYSTTGATAGIARIQIVPADPSGTPIVNQSNTINSLIGGFWPVTITN